MTASLKRSPDSPPSAELGEEEDPNKRKKPLTTERREERNLREKERSLKITQQIHELRNLLSMGGVIVPKVRAHWLTPAFYFPTDRTWDLFIDTHRSRPLPLT